MKNLSFERWLGNDENKWLERYVKEFGDEYDPDDFYDWLYEQYEIARDDQADYEHERRRAERDER